MIELPIRSIFVSDFRRLEGHRTLPLDAPVVLVHGPNGAGKTSVLSALELALTGDIRSMRRHDPRYTAHLPFHGQEFATLRVEVAEELAANDEPVTMTVAGSRVDGAPALTREAAQFYTERCYLDQVSLGQLLELYQYREGKEESALARFVNELLGLEQLDALREGLSDAMDLRRLRKLCEPLAEAESEVQRATTELSAAAKELDVARGALTSSKSELREAMAAVGIASPESENEDSLRRVADLLRSAKLPGGGGSVDLNQAITALGGRVGALASRPSVQLLEEARAATAAASVEYGRWSESHGASIEAWRSDAARLEVDASARPAEVIDEELQRIDRTLSRQVELSELVARLEQQLTDDRAALEILEAQLSGAQEQAGSLAEGLAALREHAGNDICPVCDRDFGDVSTVHLVDHIDLKIGELTTQGAQLREFRMQRDARAAQVRRDEHSLGEARAQVWSAAQREAASSRRVALADLGERLHALQPVIASGRELQRQREAAKSALEEREAAARDADLARSEIDRLTRQLGAASSEPEQLLEVAWRRLADLAAEQLNRRAAHERASEALDQTLQRFERVAALRDAVAEAAERKVVWERRVQEARRRQGVAMAVQEASSKARANIVQRVFTESLNEVWRSVFTRLAPREPFVPAFGLPSSSKTALALTLETVHTSSGVSGGSPQMMLSAGNLNTAALSLFIALHLAVEPLVPCLVLDDPLQSMDEVHVAQFAGLIRVLAKHHGRQVIIAVHERELFQYLALELSPAFPGDELITIELGARSADEDRGVTRHVWSPDPAIAV